MTLVLVRDTVILTPSQTRRHISSVAQLHVLSFKFGFPLPIDYYGETGRIGWDRNSVDDWYRSGLNPLRLD